MRKTMWAITAAALLIAGVTPMQVMAETDGAKTKTKAKVASPAKPKLSGELANIAKNADLSPEQTQQVEALAAEYNKAMSKWNADNRDAVTKAKADAASTDAETKKAGVAASNKLNAERRTLANEYTSKALALLTPEQRGNLEVSKAVRMSQSRLTKSKINLTAEQNAQIKTIAQDAFKGVDPADAAAVKKAHASVYGKVSKDVLTDEQRAQLPKPAAKPAKAAKPAAKAKPKAE